MICFEHLSCISLVDANEYGMLDMKDRWYYWVLFFCCTGVIVLLLIFLLGYAESAEQH